MELTQQEKDNIPSLTSRNEVVVKGDMESRTDWDG